MNHMRFGTYVDEIMLHALFDIDQYNDNEYISEHL